MTQQRQPLDPIRFGKLILQRKDGRCPRVMLPRLQRHHAVPIYSVQSPSQGAQRHMIFPPLFFFASFLPDFPRTNHQGHLLPIDDHGATCYWIYPSPHLLSSYGPPPWTVPPNPLRVLQTSWQKNCYSWKSPQSFAYMPYQDHPWHFAIPPWSVCPMSMSVLDLLHHTPQKSTRSDRTCSSRLISPNQSSRPGWPRRLDTHGTSPWDSIPAHPPNWRW
mmetsp:Transcript_22234/g.46048  ORF Transcript_22234/g.46048 Transcript_22234/m.46048 type:complete len:218 (+) Transcript_22234:824-1477(+)